MNSHDDADLHLSKKNWNTSRTSAFHEWKGALVMPAPLKGLSGVGLGACSGRKIYTGFGRWQMISGPEHPSAIHFFEPQKWGFSRRLQHDPWMSDSLVSN
jgi:hypothetical protein